RSYRALMPSVPYRTAVNVTPPALVLILFFFFNDTATTEIYTLSLHDALPIYHAQGRILYAGQEGSGPPHHRRSEEHTSELQSLTNLVCRLLLEKKNKNTAHTHMALLGRARSVSVPLSLPRVPCWSFVRPSVFPPPVCSIVCVFFFFFLNDRPPPEFSLFPPRALLPF